jgi:polar amino acid transport system permease protein
VDLNQLLALDVLPQLLKGAAVTLKLTLITAVLAFILSFVVGFLRLAPNVWVRRVTTAYVEILRGTSAIVQLFYLFFILPAFGISLPPTTTAVLGLGLNLSAYGSEIVRAGILAIGKGQHEGAAALGLDRIQTYRLVVLPQALVAMLPSFGNLLIELVKATSLGLAHHDHRAHLLRPPDGRHHRQDHGDLDARPDPLFPHGLSAHLDRA